MNRSSLRQVKEISMRRIMGSADLEQTDFLAAEDPLEIQVDGKSIAVVMRTPGEDRELAAGFLVTEGLIHHAEDLLAIRYRPHCLLSPNHIHPGSGPASPDILEGNVIDVRLKDPESIDLKKLTRHVFTSSSCGICSKSSIAAVRQQFPPVDDNCEVDPQVLFDLPQVLAAAQQTFQQTGGLHACALFDLAGELQVLREDVGRHNALDKVVGWSLLAGRLPLREHILVLSGRTSFEMMQKALAAGVPIVAAISAPSTLAAEFARESGQTLVGFLRGARMNIYAGANRVRSPVVLRNAGYAVNG